jgi:uncharacterized protein YjbI with pentapeptide repeats
MASAEHLAILSQGVGAWNKWRKENPNIRPDLRAANLSRADLRAANLSTADLSRADLRGAILSGAHLGGADLSAADLIEAHLGGANLFRADLIEAHLREADLIEADLRRAILFRANLFRADLRRAILIEADLRRAILSRAILSRANLFRARLSRADLRGANLSEAILSRADLDWANLGDANLSDVNLSRARLEQATLVETNLEKANLTDCHIYGISAWGVKLAGATQTNLTITPKDEPIITVDNLEVAQFIYLLLNNEKIRDVINTITSKVVLILGRFTPERKAVLDAIREQLRQRNYSPVLFDFDKPASRDITETVRTLAHLARFIIADLTDPSSIPQELQAIVPDLAVPVQPLLLEGKQEYSMFVDLPKKYHWVLKTHQYKDLDGLLATLEEKVIGPAEAKAKELETR